MTLYMHTILNRPAFFDGEQIVYSGWTVKNLCKSLKEIRKQQKQTIKFRNNNNFTIDLEDYSYVRAYL